MLTARTKRQRIFIRLGLFLGALILVRYWLVAIMALEDGKLFAYETYWHQPVGTILLTITLVTLTPIWMWALLRYWHYEGDQSELR